MEKEGMPAEEIERRLEEFVRQVEEKDRVDRLREPVDREKAEHQNKWLVFLSR